MLGAINGVSTRLAREANHIVTIHCCAHRLELAIKDLWKSLPYINDMDQVIQEAYNFYKISRTNWTGLQETAAALGMEVKRPVRLHGTRWVAHHHAALSAVYNNWPAMIVHLEDVHSNNAAGKTKREKAVDMLRAISFIYIMNFMMVYLAIIKELSLTLQKNDLTVDYMYVVDKIEAVKVSLKKLGKADKLSETIDKDVHKDDDNIKYHTEEIGFCCRESRETRGNKVETTDSITEKIKKGSKTGWRYYHKHWRTIWQSDKSHSHKGSNSNESTQLARWWCIAGLWWSGNWATL